MPILILHSDDDGFVPSTASRALAVARPDIVTYEAFEIARHTKLWNYDRARWEGAMRSWLARRADQLGHEPARVESAGVVDQQPVKGEALIEPVLPGRAPGGPAPISRGLVDRHSSSTSPAIEQRARPAAVRPRRRSGDRPESRECVGSRIPGPRRHPPAIGQRRRTVTDAESVARRAPRPARRTDHQHASPGRPPRCTLRRR